MKLWLARFKKYTPFTFWIFLSLLLLIYRRWFFDFGIISHGDWGFYYNETLTSVRIHYFSLWFPDYNFGRQLIDVGQAPTYAMYGILAKYFHANFAIAERLVHLWPCVLLAPMTSYFLAWHITRNRLSSVAAAVVYSFNSYFLILQTGHLTLAVAYSLCPLVLGLYIRCLEKSSLTFSIASALTLSLLTAYEPRTAYIILWLMFFYFIFQALLCIHNKENNYLKRLIRNSMISALMLFLFGLLNFYWIFGIALSGSNKGTELLSRGLFGSQYFGINHAITLHHPYWNGSKPMSFVNASIPPLYWVIPIMVIFGIYLNRKNTKIIFFGFLSILGVLLGKQASQPFASLYEYLFHNLPGFNLFREASKFYLVIAVGYSICIGSILKHINKRYLPKNKTLANILVATIFIIIVLPFLYNIKPVLTGEIATLFTNRSIPQDEITFKKYLQNDRNFSRVLWVPVETRWGYYDSLHPKENLAGLYYGKFSVYRDNRAESDYIAKSTQMASFLHLPYLQTLLNSGGIKYIVVPERDIENDNDFFVHYGNDRDYYIESLEDLPYLRRLDIGLENLVVFENLAYKNYFSSTHELQRIESTSSLSSKFTFFNKLYANKEFNFTLDDNIPYTNTLKDLSEDLSSKNIFDNGIQLPYAGGENTYLIDAQPRSLQLSINKDEIGFEEAPPNPVMIDGNLEAQSADVATRTNKTKFNIEQSYFIQKDDEIIAVNNNETTQNLGNIYNEATLFTASKENLIDDPSFNLGKWEISPKDCNNYDDNDIFDAQITTQYGLDKNGSLQINATRHIPCITKVIPLKYQGKALLGFQFKVVNGQEAGFKLLFNDPSKTVIKKRIPVRGQIQRDYLHTINIPEGATSAQLVLLGIPDQNLRNTTSTYYDNISLVALSPLLSYSSRNEDIRRIPLKQKHGDIFIADKETGRNLIENYSFESGSWRSEVKDCNAYDDNPRISMTISNEYTDGKKSLELKASRHLACTDISNINVEENNDYLLEFDSLSSSGNSAAYYLTFNDSQGAFYSERLDKKKEKGKWYRYSRIVTIPHGAHSATLTIYGHPGENGFTATTLYDNFKLQKLPLVRNKYYIVRASEKESATPKQITYRMISPTKKSVSIKATESPFYLIMSESYHPKWRLVLNDVQLNDVVNQKSPHYKGRFIDDKNHFTYNGFLNAWYIDTPALCAQSNACTKNPDGSYNMELVAEFTPQRWFYVGSIISGTTLAACIIYLGFTWRTKRKVYHASGTGPKRLHKQHHHADDDEDETAED